MYPFHFILPFALLTTSFQKHFFLFSLISLPYISDSLSFNLTSITWPYFCISLFATFSQNYCNGFLHISLQQVQLILHSATSVINYESMPFSIAHRIRFNPLGPSVNVLHHLDLTTSQASSFQPIPCFSITLSDVPYPETTHLVRDCSQVLIAVSSLHVLTYWCFTSIVSCLSDKSRVSNTEIIPK